MNFSHRKKVPLDISLTPMIDVVFLLLIFFMVTTTFNQQTAIKINLPQANGEQAENINKQLVLTIDAKGVYFVAGEDGAARELINQKKETLKRALVKLSGGSRSIPFVISADSQTPHQAVVTALDIAGQLGFVRVTFATKSMTEE